MKKYIEYAVVIAVAFLLSYVFIKPVQNVTNQVVDSLGSASSPSVIDGCMDVNGVTKCYKSTGLLAATTTPCAIKSPNATSTLIATTMRMNVATATAAIWTVATSTTQYATTTLVGTFTSSAASQINAYVANPNKIEGGSSLGSVAPNSYVVWGLATAGTLTLTSANIGKCQAEFLVQ